jgi:hypothetical protein
MLTSFQGSLQKKLQEILFFFYKRGVPNPPPPPPQTRRLGRFPFFPHAKKQQLFPVSLTRGGHNGWVRVSDTLLQCSVHDVLVGMALQIMYTQQFKLHPVNPPPPHTLLR